MAYTDLTSTFHYKDLLTWQNMDKLAQNDAFLKDGIIQTGDYVYSYLSSKTGFLKCDASAVSRTTYADLFAVIGTTFGSGDGSTTFNLPDGLGRAAVGAGTGSGLTARSRGDLIGAETHKHETPIWRRTSDGSLIVKATAPYGTGSNTSDATGGGGFAAGAANNPDTTYLTDSASSFQPSFVGGYWFIKT